MPAEEREQVHESWPQLHQGKMGVDSDRVRSLARPAGWDHNSRENRGGIPPQAAVEWTEVYVNTPKGYKREARIKAVHWGRVYYYATSAYYTYGRPRHRDQGEGFEPHLTITIPNWDFIPEVIEV